MQVLKGMDFSVLTPDVIVIEDWVRDSPSHETKIFCFLSDFGYTWVGRLKFSDVYILSTSQKNYFSNTNCFTLSRQ
jgi:hypothetical protein